MNAVDNKKIIQTFIENVFCGADRQAAIDVLADDCTWWMIGNLPTAGLHEGKQAVIDGVLAAGDGMIEPGSLFANVSSLICEGDRAAAEWVGGFKTVTGADYQNTYSVTFELKDGKIKGVREYNDTHYMVTFLSNLG